MQAETPNRFNELQRPHNARIINNERNKNHVDLMNAFARWVGTEKIKRHGRFQYEAQRPWMHTYNMYPWANVDTQNEVVKEKINPRYGPFEEEEDVIMEKPRTAVSTIFYLSYQSV